MPGEDDDEADAEEDDDPGDNDGGDEDRGRGDQGTVIWTIRAKNAPNQNWSHIFLCKIEFQSGFVFLHFLI